MIYNAMLIHECVQSFVPHFVYFLTYIMSVRTFSFDADPVGSLGNILVCLFTQFSNKCFYSSQIMNDQTFQYTFSKKNDMV